VALALLGGAPAVLTAADIRAPWVLAVATGMAAVVIAVGAVWQDRYQGHARRLDEQELGIQEGCLMINGRLPKVSEVRDPLYLGVHPAPIATLAPDHDESSPALSDVPAYVPRDVDDQLREMLAQGGFVLLVGDATAGKSRTCYEAITTTLPDHILIAPHDRDALPSALAKASDTHRCVLWLNDLEGYLGTGALTRNKVTGLVSEGNRHRVILATLRAAEEIRYTSDTAGPEAGRRAHRDARNVLEQAHRLRLPRLFSAAEQRRAHAREWDPRIADAMAHADTYGIAEYLAAGPELLRDWEDAWTPNTDPAAPANPRGAALVAAAVDIRRAGWSTPIPVRLLDQVHEHYLAGFGGDRLNPEQLTDAWEWACRPRHGTTALLQHESDSHVQVFDYLVDVMQRRSLPSDHVPELVVRAAVEASSPAESDALAASAYLEGRYLLAEYAYRHSYLTRARRPDLGPDHPDTLASRNSLALALRALGRLTEAESEHREVCRRLNGALGPDHAFTLTSRGDLARVLRTMGRFEEAEAEHRAVAEALARELGPEHAETLASRGDHARALHALGRFSEAEAEHDSIYRTRRRLLGPEHPSTLASRGSRASVLHELGRYKEAENEHRAILEIRIRRLGPEHPRTLTSRGDLARALRELGRLDEAEAEHRAVLDIRRRVLGAEHHRTLASRGCLASVWQDLGRHQEAADEHRAVLSIRSRVLGEEHPRTLTSRADLGRALQAMGQLPEAEAEHRAVLGIRRRVLGEQHPETLASWHGVASTLNDLDRHAEAAAEFSAVLHLRIMVLGTQHPATRASQAGLNKALDEQANWLPGCD